MSEETIAERLASTKVPDPHDDWEKGVPPWVFDGPPPTAESIVVEVPSEEKVVLEMTKIGDMSTKPKRFLELVQAGQSPGAAAKKLNTTLGEITKDRDLKAKLKKLLEVNRLPGLLRKEMVRAGLNQIFLENFDGNSKEQKLAVAASKEIGKDPEVGLNLPPVVGGVVIDMAQFARVMNDMKPIPGLETILDGDSDVEAPHGNE